MTQLRFSKRSCRLGQETRLDGGSAHHGGVARDLDPGIIIFTGCLCVLILQRLGDGWRGAGFIQVFVVSLRQEGWPRQAGYKARNKTQVSNEAAQELCNFHCGQTNSQSAKWLITYFKWKQLLSNVNKDGLGPQMGLWNIEPCRRTLCEIKKMWSERQNECWCERGRAGALSGSHRQSNSVSEK